MKKKRKFYTMKFTSSRLKEFSYTIHDLSYHKAKQLGEVIGLADNQILRSIRDIQNRYVDVEYIDSLYVERDELKCLPATPEIEKKIKALQEKIDYLTFVPEYITIVMEHPKHYEHLFYNGLLLNGKRYNRFSCSASQARTSTVVFCDETIYNELSQRLNNGRDLSRPLTPSKFNAYFGLAGSATHVVSTPNFCLVPDYNSNKKFTVNYITETAEDEDDKVEIKHINEVFNRFDGQGLISIRQAKKWSEELGLNYIPAQWCIRQNFIKGMLCTFDIHKFCKEINNGNYEIQTSYKDEFGNFKTVDLRDIDVILTESQFKLWDSYESLDTYIKNCEQNKLFWGVSLYTAKSDKNILKLNYQFLQTLNLNKEDIKNVSSMFVNWIQNVTSKNIESSLLFLLGENINEANITYYLSESNNYWIKALLWDHSLLQDKYIQQKIYDLVKTKIQRACLGEIIVDGNFQVIVSDPYAQMEHVCGLPVKGLLKEKQYYSSYWNKRNVKVVNSMRAPLTYRSEHVKLTLINSNELESWYLYCYTGIIVNVHGHETVNWSGSDFDYDILATTSNQTIINGVFENELPVAYQAPKSIQKVITQQDLYEADLFSFGSQIGSITNKSTSGYALLSLYPEHSIEYSTLLNRLKMCTKLQSAQIDKAKIGREVKGIPKTWTKYNKIDENDPDEVKNQKLFFNSVLLDKHPYFFIFLYDETKKRYNQHYKKHNLASMRKFNMSIAELIAKLDKSMQEQQFLRTYFEFMPVIESDSVMNNLCKHIESINFDIKNQVKIESDNDIYKSYMNEHSQWINREYNLVVKKYDEAVKSIIESVRTGTWDRAIKVPNAELSTSHHKTKYDQIELSLNSLNIPLDRTVNYLIYYLYIEKNKLSKDILWNVYGSVIVDNIKRRKKGKISIPIKSETGNLHYLGDRYEFKVVQYEEDKSI